VLIAKITVDATPARIGGLSVSINGR
jgi:hypothetical protein